MNLIELLHSVEIGEFAACQPCPWNPKKHKENVDFGKSCILHGIDWTKSDKAISMLIAQDPAGTTPSKTGNLCGVCNVQFSTDKSAQHGYALWKAAVSLADSGSEAKRFFNNHYWTNATMHGIKDDKQREIARQCCEEILFEQIRILSPQVIIVTGKSAAESLFNLKLISRHWDEFKENFSNRVYSEKVTLPSGQSSRVFCTFHGSATAVNTHVARLYSKETISEIQKRIEQLPDARPAQQFLRQFPGYNAQDKGMRVLLLHWLDIGHEIRLANESSPQQAAGYLL